MEDDYVDARIEEDKMPAEANKKRKLKTPAQLQGLEEYYEEHKYPTESLKSEIAVRLGLTEKQVSGWFCHRRLKDKRLSKEEVFGNGRMDRSSGVIHELGSEPGQDSCGSTKPGGYNKHGDLREVESQLLEEVSPKNIGCHKRMNAMTRLDYDMDETSSESSSPLRPSDFSQRDVPQMFYKSKYGVGVPSNSKVVIGNQLRRPSGYLKIIPKTEHPAISGVKRQLGNNFMQDGPPLGIQFDQLPIDAFQAAPQVTAKRTNNEANSLMCSLSGRGANCKLKMPKGLYSRPDDIYLKEPSSVVNNESEVCYSNHQSRSKSYSHNNGLLDNGWEPSSNLNREYTEETNGCTKAVSNRAMYKSKGFQVQSSPRDQFSPCAETLTTEHTDASLHNSSYENLNNIQRSKNLKNQPLKRKLTHREPCDTVDRMTYTRELEIQKQVPVSSKTSEPHNLVTSTAIPDYEFMDDYHRPYRLRDAADNDLDDKDEQVSRQRPIQELTKKCTFPTIFVSGAARAEITSSSSSSEDDDTLETSSSDNE